MEEWFHDENDKMEVENSSGLVARVLMDLKYLFHDQVMDTRCLSFMEWQK